MKLENSIGHENHDTLLEFADGGSDSQGILAAGLEFCPRVRKIGEEIATDSKCSALENSETEIIGSQGDYISGHD